MTPWPALSVRARLTLATTGVVALALGIGGFVLVTVLGVTQLRQRDEAARDQARGIATLVTSHRLPDPVPTGGTTIVQVVDAQGRVRAASAGGDRLVPCSSPRTSRGCGPAAPSSCPADGWGSTIHSASWVCPQGRRRTRRRCWWRGRWSTWSGASRW